MNEKLDFIFSRRSIRQFRDQRLDGGVIQDLLEAAMAAPSACAKDPWHFVVLKAAESRKKLAAGLPYGGMLADAACGVVVCGDLAQAHDGQLSYLLQDCSAAIESLLLAANGLGLGACWLGIHPRSDRIEYVRTLLALPEKIIPVSAVAIGYPSEQRDKRTRYRAAAVHHEKW